MQKKIIAVVAAAVVLCVGGFLYYKHLTASPEYIVKHTVEAYEQKNFSEFEKYFDIDNFSRHLWTDYNDWLAKNLDSIWTPIRSNMDSVDSLKIAFRNVVSGKKTLKDLDMIEESSSQTVSFAQLLENFHEPKITILSENDSEKKIRLTAKTFDEQEFDLELIIRNVNGAWKISELVNVGEVCTVFKNFAKDSLIAYLKNVQPIQDKYTEMWQNADKQQPKGDMQYSLRSTEEANLWKNYLLSRKQAEDYRVAELSEVQTNPFSDILNSNRIDVSKYFSQGWDGYLQQFQKGMELRNFSAREVQELQEKADKNFELARDEDVKVRTLIDLVDYKP